MHTRKQWKIPKISSLYFSQLEICQNICIPFVFIVLEHTHENRISHVY